MKKRIKKEKKPIFPVRDVDRQLQLACNALNIRGIRSAISAGADVNALDETHEYSPLDIVVNSVRGWENYRSKPDYQRQIRSILEVLLSNGANANGYNGEERPLLVFTWDLCDPEACALLLQHGAAVNFECYEKRSVLDMVWEESTYLATTEGSKETIQRLDKISKMLEKHGAKSFYDPLFKDKLKGRYRNEMDEGK